MNIGDVKLIKINQSYTTKQARGKLCVIQDVVDNCFIVRIQDDDGYHYTQYANEDNLEEVE